MAGQFSRLSEMTDANKVMNPQHFGSDPADIRMWIRINSEIWIGILQHHFWLRLAALFALSEHSLVYKCIDSDNPNWDMYYTEKCIIPTQ